MDPLDFSWGRAIELCLMSLMSYVQGGFAIPFLYGLGAVRIRADRDAVVLRGVDAMVSCWGGGALCVVASVGVGMGLVAGIVTTAIALLVWFGFRVEIRTTCTETRVVRTFLYVVPWSVRTVLGRVMVITDGWGDFLDPLTLLVRFDGTGREIELAWQGRGEHPRGADSLAREFNAAVARLRDPERSLFDRGPYR